MLRLALRSAFCCILLTTTLAAEKETFTPANDVSFRISTDKSNYRVGQNITVEYKVTNTSNRSLYVPRDWAVTCPPFPYVWAWLEDSSGKHFVGGYAGSCSSTPVFSERMSKEAVLLKRREHLYGTFLVDTKLFDLKPGAYRIEATLTGWRENKFTEAERSELARMGHPFLRGEVPDSIRITLTQ
jgi:hypothetical protein